MDNPIKVQSVVKNRAPTAIQRAWLERGLAQPGGKLPLFDRLGQQIDPRTIKACIDQGWAEPWFSNPLKPDWLVCRLTPAGREVASARLGVKAAQELVEFLPAED